MECLKDLVGLSLNDCNCFETDRPADYNTSKSGLFLDDPEHSMPIKFPDGAAGCGDGGVWSILNESRDAGIKEFLIDFGAGMENEYLHKRPNWRGMLGLPKDNAAYYGLASPLAGFQFAPIPLRGATLVIRTLGLYMASANTPAKTVKVYREGNNTPLAEANVTVEANKRVEVTLADPLHLPLTDTNGELIRYFFAYERHDDDPMDVRFTCGCGNEVNKGWDKYGALRGLQGQNINEFFGSDKDKGSTYSNGIIVGADLFCGATDWLCQLTETSSLGPYMAVVAKLIQLYSINKMLAKVLNSGQINRFTATEVRRENLYGKRRHNRSVIEQRMPWLLMQAQFQGVNDCIKCKSNNIIRTATIKA